MNRREGEESHESSPLQWRSVEECEYLLLHEIGGRADIVYFVVVGDAAQSIPPDLVGDLLVLFLFLFLGIQV